MLMNNSELCINCTEGTVQVCYDNDYGTVCDDFWDELDALVVCDGLGFATADGMYMWVSYAWGVKYVM